MSTLCTTFTLSPQDIKQIGRLIFDEREKQHNGPFSYNYFQLFIGIYSTSLYYLSEPVPSGINQNELCKSQKTFQVKHIFYRGNEILITPSLI